MCILCVVQRWSRRIATMLPWLVLPLILLWAFSQLLPPGYRFEVTSPRLACVSVLLLTLFWYEILLPQLSLWRARRSERLREERLAQALKLQKLRKTATRRCRNCSNPYRDQNPAGGKFMCSYCGHISKRPVLDLPGLMSPEGKSRWGCSQDWLSEGSGKGWSGAVPWHWLEDRCSAEKSYNGLIVFSRRMFTHFFTSMRLVCRKIFPLGVSREDELSDEERNRAVNRGESGSVSQESRLEKARRKAEEKRLARLEKEMLEEEERKQREEVARLVEERRKLRDEKQEAEERAKGATPVGERDSRKDLERRRLERRKEKDRVSNKSISDCEEAERKRESDRKSETERRDSLQGISEVSSRTQHVGAANKNKYFGRVTGNFLSSSRGLSGASFFGRGNQNSSVPMSKPSKVVSGLIDQATLIKPNATTTASTLTKAHSGGDNRTLSVNGSQQVVSGSHQPRTTGLKKSWHQLFTRSSSVSPSLDMGASTNEINIQPEVSSTLTASQPAPSAYPPYNQFSFGQPMPFAAYPAVNEHLSTPSFVPFGSIAMRCAEEPEVNTDELENFEDPCYDPNAFALLGPVSDSFDDFPSDLGCGFISNDILNKHHPLKSGNVCREISKPSPIKSPLSKSRVFEENHMDSNQLASSAKKIETSPSRLTQLSTEEGTWKMWDTPLVQDSLGLVNGHSSWFSNSGSNFRHVDGLPTNRPSHHLSPIGPTNGQTFSPASCGLLDSDLWGPKNYPDIFTVGGTRSLFSDFPEDIMGNDVSFGSANESATLHPYELSGANSWSK